MEELNRHMDNNKESDFYFSSHDNGRLLINARYPNWIQDPDDRESMTIVLTDAKQKELYNLLRVKFEQGYTWEQFLMDVETE